MIGMSSFLNPSQLQIMSETYQLVKLYEANGNQPLQNTGLLPTQTQANPLLNQGLMPAQSSTPSFGQSLFPTQSQEASLQPVLMQMMQMLTLMMSQMGLSSQ